MSNLPEALIWQEKAIEIRESLYPNGIHSELASSYNNLAVIYYGMRETPKALNKEAESFFVFHAVLGKEHPNAKSALSKLYRFYTENGLRIGLASG